MEDERPTIDLDTLVSRVRSELPSHEVKDRRGDGWNQVIIEHDFYSASFNASGAVHWDGALDFDVLDILDDCWRPQESLISQ